MEPEGSIPHLQARHLPLSWFQLDPFHAPTSQFLKIHLIIILPSTTGSSKWSLSLKFPLQSPVYISPLPRSANMPRPSHSSWIDHPNKIMVEEYRSWRSSLCSFRHSPISSSLLGQNVLLSTLFSNTISLLSSLSDQVSHPYKTIGKLWFCIS